MGPIERPYWSGKSVNRESAGIQGGAGAHGHELLELRIGSIIHVPPRTSGLCSINCKGTEAYRHGGCDSDSPIV